LFGRLFSFGIGEGASTSLVKGIARAGRGKAEFTKDDERLQPLVRQFLFFMTSLIFSKGKCCTDGHRLWGVCRFKPQNKSISVIKA